MFRFTVALGALALLALPYAAAQDVDVTVPIVEQRVTADGVYDTGAGSHAVALSGPVATSAGYADPGASDTSGASSHSGSESYSSPSSDGSAPPPTLVIDFPPVARTVNGVVSDVTRTVGGIPILRSAPNPREAPSAPASAPPAPVYVGHVAPAASVAPAAPGSAIAAVALATAAAPVAANGGLWARLRRFGGLAALYTRIAKERLLDHGAREHLLDAVRATPGSSLADLARASGLARNTAVYHMFRLEREGLVSSLRNGRSRLYYAPGALEQRERAPVMAAVRHPVTASIARQVGAHPGLDQHSICARFGLAPSLAHWHAKRLVQAGVVEQRRDGRYVRYYPGANFASAMSG